MFSSHLTWRVPILPEINLHHQIRMRGFVILFTMLLAVKFSTLIEAQSCRRSLCYNEPPREGYDVRYPCANLSACDLPYGLKRKQGGCEYDDIDECMLKTHECDVHANCLNNIGSYTCACTSGFGGAGFACQDIDECMLKTHECDVHANCLNTIGSYTCSCTSGFGGTGFACQDIDECVLKTHECGIHANCSNTIGSYTCTCNSGFSGTGLVCQDICLPNPCANNGTCQVINGEASCECTEHYFGTNCQNQECPTGWSLNGDSCYIVHNNNEMTWYEARDYCQSFDNGTHLAVIRDEEQNNFIRSLLSGGWYWIGLNDKYSDGSWSWISGDNDHYRRWATNEPGNNINEDCAIISSGGYWKDVGCTYMPWNVICEQAKYNQSM